MALAALTRRAGAKVEWTDDEGLVRQGEWRGTYHYSSPDLLIVESDREIHLVPQDIVVWAEEAA